MTPHVPRQAWTQVVLDTSPPLVNVTTSRPVDLDEQVEITLVANETIDLAGAVRVIDAYGALRHVGFERITDRHLLIHLPTWSLSGDTAVVLVDVIDRAGNLVPASASVHVGREPAYGVRVIIETAYGVEVERIEAFQVRMVMRS